MPAFAQRYIADDATLPPRSADTSTKSMSHLPPWHPQHSAPERLTYQHPTTAANAHSCPIPASQGRRSHYAVQPSEESGARRGVAGEDGYGYGTAGGRAYGGDTGFKQGRGGYWDDVNAGYGCGGGVQGPQSYGHSYAYDGQYPAYDGYETGQPRSLAPYAAQSHARQHSGYYDQQADQSGYTGQREHHWHHPQWQEFQGWSPGHEQQYAQPTAYQPQYQPSGQYSGYDLGDDQYWLMQQYEAAANLASAFNAQAQAFQPAQAHPAPETRKSQKQTPQSVSEIGMHGLAHKARLTEAKQASKGPKPAREQKTTSTREPAPAVQLTSKPRSVNGSESPKRPHLRLLPRPKPTWSYLKQAAAAPGELADGGTRALLVILDLNGTLLHRTRRGGSAFTARSHVPEFLHYLLSHHKVMIWSSATPENVHAMVAKLLTPEQRKRLVAVWGREKLRLSPAQYGQKVQCYKQLSWVWRDEEIATSAPGHDAWAQDNTVLIDDSAEKAASEPYNSVTIDEFEGTEAQGRTDVLGQVVQYLEVLRGARD
ncbi:hypothetical protein LTR53_017758, partial [Teratosphaeriaceae sp. CCFEE 6253]